MRFVWIPEAPRFPGIYAPADYHPGANTVTDIAEEAMHFPDWESCLLWCQEHPHPPYHPREHGFI